LNKEEETYKYFRIGRLAGRAGSISHIALEKHNNGGRIILADSYKHPIHTQDISEEGLLNLYLWLKYQIEDISTKKSQTTAIIIKEGKNEK